MVSALIVAAEEVVAMLVALEASVAGTEMEDRALEESLEVVEALEEVLKEGAVDGETPLLALVLALGVKLRETAALSDGEGEALGVRVP